MRKFLSLILACVIGVSFSVTAFADDVQFDTQTAEVPNGYFGIVTDEFGNIVETIPMPVERMTYVDTVITLQPGNSLTIYQYTPTTYFAVGLRIVTRTPTPLQREIVF